MKSDSLNIPYLRDGEKYIGLYVVDFGDHSGVGYTSQEVAELLESEKFKDIKVYKIHNAYPDGRLELRGVRNQLFNIEMGMFFYEGDLSTAKADYRQLLQLAVKIAPPSNAKLHLAKYSEDKYVTAVIYPAEYNDEFSAWLLDNDYKTSGETLGGIGIVTQYYTDEPQLLDHHQLLGRSTIESRTGEELLRYSKVAVQR